MSAQKMFQWVIEESFPRPDEETKKLIHEKRDYFFTLRSEDEQQRFVEGLEEEVRQYVTERRGKTKKNFIADRKP